MTHFKFGIFVWLFFLLNAVTFNVDGGDGGGSSDGGGNSDGGDGGAGSQGGAGDGGSGGSGEPGGSGGDGGQGGTGGGQGDDGKVDLSSLPEATQKYIKDLRTENAKHRTDLRTTQDRLGKIEGGLKSIFGEGEGDQVSPEEQVAHLTNAAEGLQMQNAVLNIALDQGLSSQQADYFQFLLQKEGEFLDDNEEISDERFEELIGTAKGVGAQNQGGTDGGSTSVDGDGNPPQGGSDEVTEDQFSKMSYMEKVNLRKKNEPLYNKLFAATMKK